MSASTTTTNGNQTRHPQLPEPLRSAIIAHEDGDLNTAYPLYRSFVAENPKNPTGLQLFGLLLSHLGQHDTAISLMQESLSLFPEQAQVANNLGNALSQVGKVDEAIASYQNALRQQPDYLDARRNLGLCYAKSGRPEEAMASYELCLKSNPDDVQTLFAVANLKRDLHEYDAAIAMFDRVISLAPNHADAHHNRGVVLRLLKPSRRSARTL